jgi:hypothetical protein
LTDFLKKCLIPPVHRPDPEGSVRSAPFGRDKQPKGQHKMIRSILAVVGLLAWAGVGQAATLSLVNTGNNGAANGTVDPNWTVGGPISGDTFVIAAGGPNFPTPWIGASAGPSQWISVAPDPFSPNGTYTFRTTVDLTGLDPASALITGRWAADNIGHIAVNGVDVGFAPTGGLNTDIEGFHDWTPFSLSGMFAPGVNTLDFVVENLHNNSPVGVRVELSGGITGSGDPVPEPSSMLVFGLAVGAAALRRRRNNATVV